MAGGSSSKWEVMGDELGWGGGGVSGSEEGRGGEGVLTCDDGEGAISGGEVQN
jgi:hypothetical protein